MALGWLCEAKNKKVCWWYSFPGDFVTNVKQINSQSDLTSMLSFAGPSYLTVRISLYIILIWDSCISNLYNLCQTGVSYLRRKPHQCALRLNKQITRTHFLQLQPSFYTSSSSSYFTVEKAIKTLYWMSPCTPVSVNAKITWLLLNRYWDLKNIGIFSNESIVTVHHRH